MKRVELLDKVLELTEQPGKLEEAKALAASEGVHPHMHEGNSNLNEYQKIEWLVGQLIDSEVYSVMYSQSTVIKISQGPLGRPLTTNLNKELKMNIRAFDPDREEMYGDGMMYGKEELMDDSLSIRFEHFECDEPVFMYGSAENDINQIEIFSGDIVKCTYLNFIEVIGQVKFGSYEQDGSGGEYIPETCNGFYLDVINKNEVDEWGCKVVSEHIYTSNLSRFEGIEIIGNIHQHPHLLGKANE